MPKVLWLKIDLVVVCSKLFLEIQMLWLTIEGEICDQFTLASEWVLFIENLTYSRLLKLYVYRVGLLDNM